MRRGRGDPAWRPDQAGVIWLAGNTPAGAGTLAISSRGDEIRASAWGPGAAWLLDGLPTLLGADDDDQGFVAHHPLIVRLRRRLPGLRLGATGRVWDVLLAAVLEQKVTSFEAHRLWCELTHRFGTSAPGPVPAGLAVPPTPEAVLEIRDWEWHRAGLDGARRHTVIRAAAVARRLEHAARLGGVAGRELLRQVPGVGVWTAAEVAQRAWGDPDAVSVGDLHLSRMVGAALVGVPLDDAGMLAVLAPYAPQRQRVVRYLKAAGIRPPRFQP